MTECTDRCRCWRRFVEPVAMWLVFLLIALLFAHLW
jgi:hypothetical protein